MHQKFIENNNKNYQLTLGVLCIYKYSWSWTLNFHYKPRKEYFAGFLYGGNMNIKNISILAHVDAGKTSLTEAFLNTSGTKHNFGSVDEGTTYTDTDSLEIEKGISIYTSTTSTVYKNTKINIIDTPGHMDFINEVEQALIATDLAILVIAANDNKLKSQTYDVYHKLIELNIPTLIFINKIDLDNADVDNVISPSS